MIWKNGQIDAHSLPNGSIVSEKLTIGHVKLVQNNSRYREDLEKAGKIAGYTPPVLTLARNSSGNAANIRALMRQNAQAEQLSKGNRDETGNRKSDIVVVSR